MLIERLFSSGIMKMGPSRVDPERQVDGFNPAVVAGLAAVRAADLSVPPIPQFAVK